MFDFRGKRVRKAEPSMPVSVMGLNEIPSPGDLFEVVESEKEAKMLVEQRLQAKVKPQESQKEAITLEQLFDRFQAGEVRELRLVVKADVQGSLEPVLSSLNDLGKGEIKLNILHGETGNITENDVMLASASKAIVVGFNVQADVAARKLAESEGVSIRLYEIIYRLLEDIERALKGMLEPVEVETTIGQADVRAVFRISKIGAIAGCRITNGEIRRGARARVRRRGETVFEGYIHSLKHLQEDVKELRSGFECGIGIKNFDGFEVGDIIECYLLEKVAAG
jgi:translation initiation factor IF-2